MKTLNHLKTAFLLGSLIGLCMLVGHLLGGPQGLLLGLVFGGLGNLVAYWFSDRIALTAMQAQPVNHTEAPWLVDTVERLALRAGLPTPRVYVCPHSAPNAFATGRNPRNSAVAITAGMLRDFPRHEIEAVMAHEIAHIKNRDVLIATVAAVLGGLISYAGYSLMFVGGGRDNQNPLGALGAIVAVLLAPIAALLIQMAISRQREYAADALGGELCGDPRNLALALHRLQGGNQRVATDVNLAFNSMFIMQPLSARGMATLFSTHPPVEKRIAALERQAAREPDVLAALKQRMRTVRMPAM
ncbi:MAG: M48 family metalloprotease [Phycisphaerae bacterium]